ncbi:YIP1 family protein [Methanoculleus palmolei]|uniref:YIP1 family protein n=1 Tax=Methanoculleus palmolei TaxID=72612 RepID=A0ABD8A7L8_9EURY|nr:YIP1 family protein [Methanoculleus palmolei]
MDLHPDTFFQERLSGEVTLWFPAVVVFAAAVVQAGFVGLFVSSVDRLIPYQGLLDPAMPMVPISCLIAECVIWVLLAAYFWIFTPGPAGSPRQNSFKKTLAVSGYGRIPVVIGYIILAVLFVVVWPMAGIAPTPGEKYYEYLDAEAEMRVYLDQNLPEILTTTGSELRVLPLQREVQSLQREAREEALAGYSQVIDQVKQSPVMIAFFAAAKGLLVILILWGGTIMAFGLKQAAGISMKASAILVAVPVGLQILLLVMSGPMP